MAKRKEITLPVDVREEVGPGPVKRMRLAGRIPGIVYGKGTKPLQISAADIPLSAVINQRGVITLTYDGGEDQSVMIREVQRDFLLDKLLHVDFQIVHMDEKITTMIPVTYTGEAAGLAEGGQLQQNMYDIEVQCLPSDLPDRIEVDITHMELNASITVGELVLGADVELGSTDPATTIFSVNLPKVAEEPEPEEGLEEGEEGAEAAEGEEGEGEAKGEGDSDKKKEEGGK